MERSPNRQDRPDSGRHQEYGPGPIDWEHEFPMPQEAEDFAGNVRRFEVTCHFNGLGYSVRAVEAVGERTGYEFAAYSETSPYNALGRVRQKMNRGLATRHLTGTPGAYHMLHDTLKGHIGWTGERGTALVVDGKTVTMENLTTILQTHEGWVFELTITDALE